MLDLVERLHAFDLPVGNADRIVEQLAVKERDAKDSGFIDGRAEDSTAVLQKVFRVVRAPAEETNGAKGFV